MALGNNAETTMVNGQLEPFLILAKSARGAAAADLITQVASAPNVYVFGELLRYSNMQDLANKPETKSFWDLLQLFAYGTYADYVQNRAALPNFTDAMLLKLRQLTIVTLASENKHIPYDCLLQELGLQHVRELEDLIIDAVYNGVIVGKLDQRNQKLEVDRCMGRDVRPEEIPSILTKLTEWCDRCEVLLSITEEQMNRANAAKNAAADKNKSIEADFNNAKKALKATSGKGAPSTHVTDFDDLMADVSSSAEPEKKKEKPGRKAGLRGSSTKGFMKN